MPTKNADDKDEDFHYKPWDILGLTFEEKSGMGYEPSQLTRRKRGRRPGSMNNDVQKVKQRQSTAQAGGVYPNMCHESKVKCFVQCSQCSKMKSVYSRK